MRIDGNTPVDLLLHGDDISFVDLNEDEVMHWKYIRKEKRPNGKWRYFYTTAVKDALRSVAEKKMKEATDEMLEAEGDARNFQDYVSLQEQQYPGEEYKEYIEDLHKDLEEKWKKVEELEKKAAEAVDKYNKYTVDEIEPKNTAIGNAVKKAVESGLKKISSLFDGIFKKK